MRITKTLLSVGVVGALAVGSVLAGSGAAQADTQQRVVRFDVNAPFGPAFIPGPWHVGDCWLFQGTYLAFAGAGIKLHGESGTEHTDHADIWHSEFRFQNSNGVTLFRVGPTSALDSPRMVPANGSSGPSNPYTWDRPVDLTPAQRMMAPNVTQVVWTSSC